MDENSESPGVALFFVVAILAFVLLGDLVCAVGFISGRAEIILAFPGVFIAVVVVWAIVRWFNRRDDPHHAKPPHETP